MEIIDQLQRKLTLNRTPRRIISLVPSQTELLVALGLRESIVGITKFCVHPADLKGEKTVVGGTKQVHFSKIKSLGPDIIICNKEENTEAMVQQLQEIAPVWISDVKTIEDSTAMILQLGEIFQKGPEASQIVSRIECEMRRHRSFMKPFSTKKVLYLIWKNPYMAVGKGTFINSLLRENNFENIFTEKMARYPEVAPEDFKKPDLILLSTEPYPFNETDVVKFKEVFKTEVKLVDGAFFSWYGSRLANAFQYFRTLHEGRDHLSACLKDR